MGPRGDPRDGRKRVSQRVCGGWTAGRGRGPLPPTVLQASRKTGTRGKAAATKQAQRGSSNVFSMFEQAQIQEFKEAFSCIDQNRDGIICKSDLRETYSQLGKLSVPDEELDAMLQEGKGPINFTVFLTLFGEKLNGELGVRDPPPASAWSPSPVATQAQRRWPHCMDLPNVPQALPAKSQLQSEQMGLQVHFLTLSPDLLPASSPLVPKGHFVSVGDRGLHAYPGTLPGWGQLAEGVGACPAFSTPGTDPEEAILSAFRMFDPSGQGVVNKDEFKQLLLTQADKFSLAEVEQMFALTPMDLAGNIDYKSLCYIITHGDEKEE
nr:myosin regulatory light chain 2, atrial isoform [Loxodonta africana]